jgi:hypothetical protein
MDIRPDLYYSNLLTIYATYTLISKKARRSPSVLSRMRALLARKSNASLLIKRIEGDVVGDNL